MTAWKPWTESTFQAKAKPTAVSAIPRTARTPAAVRTEEIFYNHSLVLDGLGRTDEARASLSRAWAVIESKLERMQNPTNRAAFTERVPLTVAITAAHKDLAQGLHPAVDEAP